MHIEFRAKFNRVNSNKNKVFFPQEIDLFLNDQFDKFVELRTSPKGNYKNEGFEESQKRLDDIRTILKEGTTLANVEGKVGLTLASFPKGKLIVLPNDYLKLIADSSDTYTGCANYSEVPNRLFSSEIIKNAMRDSFHTTHHLSPISELINTTLKVYENNFTVSAIHITYVYKYPKIEYNVQNCVLPVHTHREIVDMAVAKVDAVVNAGNYEKYLNEINKNE